MKRTLAIAVPILLLFLGGGAGVYHFRKPVKPFAKLVVATQGPPTLVIEGCPPIPIHLGEGCEEPILESKGRWLSLEWSSVGRRKLKNLSYEEGLLQISGSFERCDPSAGAHALFLLPGGDARFVPLEQPIRIRSWTGNVGGRGITLWTFAGQSTGALGPEDFDDFLLLVQGLPRSGSQRSTSKNGAAGGTEAWTLAETVKGETIEIDLTPADKRAALRLLRGGKVMEGELRLTFEEDWRPGDPAPTAAPTTSASY